MIISVENTDSIKMYSSGIIRKCNEKGEFEEVIRTDEEKLQSCYKSLIEDVKRKEFNKVMISIILGYLEWDKDSFENIKIVVDDKHRHCEMNISNNLYDCGYK